MHMHAPVGHGKGLVEQRCFSDRTTPTQQHEAQHGSSLVQIQKQTANSSTHDGVPEADINELGMAMDTTAPLEDTMRELVMQGQGLDTKAKYY